MFESKVCPITKLRDELSSLDGSGATLWLPSSDELETLQKMVRALRTENHDRARLILENCFDRPSFAEAVSLVYTALQTPHATYTVGVFNAVRLTFVARPSTELDTEKIALAFARVDLGLSEFKHGHSVMTGERFGRHPSRLYQEMSEYVINKALPLDAVRLFGFVGWFAYEIDPAGHRVPGKQPHSRMGDDGPTLEPYTAANCRGATN